MNQPLRSAADFQYQELIHIWKWLSSVVLYSNRGRRGNPPHSSQHATYRHRAIFHVDHNQVVVGSLTVSYSHLPQVIKWSWKIQYFVLKHEALPILSSVEKKNSFLSTFRGSRHQAQTESPYMAWWLNLFSASHNSFCCYRWVTDDTPVTASLWSLVSMSQPLHSWVMTMERKLKVQVTVITYLSKSYKASEATSWWNAV